MSESNLPPGWTEERVREVLDHYENQTDEEALTEDEGGAMHAQVRSGRLVKRDRLEALLVEGVENGEPTEMTGQDWEDIRHEGLQQLEARKLQKSI